MTIQENGPSSLCDIIAGFHSRTKQAQTERDSFFFLTECLIHVLFLDITSKVTQEMAELCTEYQQSQLRVSEKKGKNWLILLTLTVYACLMGEGNTAMTSQSKLDPFPCIVIHGSKCAKLPCFARVQHLKEKSRAKNFFSIVNRAVAKVYLSKKIWGISGTWITVIIIIS